jgi:hypothetical protein
MSASNKTRRLVFSQAGSGDLFPGTQFPGKTTDFLSETVPAAIWPEVREPDRFLNGPTSEQQSGQRESTHWANRL